MRRTLADVLVICQPDLGKSGAGKPACGKTKMASGFRALHSFNKSRKRGATSPTESPTKGRIRDFTVFCGRIRRRPRLRSTSLHLSANASLRRWPVKARRRKMLETGVAAPASAVCSNSSINTPFDRRTVTFLSGFSRAKAAERKATSSSSTARSRQTKSASSTSAG